MLGLELPQYSQSGRGKAGNKDVKGIEGFLGFRRSLVKSPVYVGTHTSSLLRGTHFRVP